MCLVHGGRGIGYVEFGVDAVDVGDDGAGALDQLPCAPLVLSPVPERLAIRWPSLRSARE